jgi:putative PIN family toxin of toxin-antitoxin system
MRITLDTNVLISATFWKGYSYEVIQLVLSNTIENVISPEILEEYNRILNSKRISDSVQNKKLAVQKAVNFIISNSIIVKPEFKVDIIKEDPADNRILECAISGKSEYIITHDNHLLKNEIFEGIRIITPKDFLEILFGKN